MPSLYLPISDNDEVETNLEQDRREAYETHSRDEVPRLTNIKAVLAVEYFNYGWNDAIALYTKKPAIVQDKVDEPTTFAFDEITMHKVMASALNGTENQRIRARAHLKAFIRAM